MTTRILIVRHGRTEWNKGEIFRGTVDIPLDDQGRREAACAREWVRSEKLDAAYASPLSRAMETAQIILEPHGLPVIPHPGLTDLNYGDWQGVSLSEVRQRYPELYKTWKQSPHTVVFPNGEGLASVRDRAVGAVQEIVERHPGKSVLLAAHRVVNKVLVMALLGLDNSHFWRIGQDTAALNEFTLEDGFWICRRVNDTGHLRDLEGRVSHDF